MNTLKYCQYLTAAEQLCIHESAQDPAVTTCNLKCEWVCVLCVLRLLALRRRGRAVNTGRAGPKRSAHDVIKGSPPSDEQNQKNNSNTFGFGSDD